MKKYKVILSNILEGYQTTKAYTKVKFPKLKGYAMFLVDKNVLCMLDKITQTHMQDLFFMNMKLTKNMFSLKKDFFTE